MSDDKFRGAKFESDFNLTKETMAKGVEKAGSKKEFFKKLVEEALDRVKNDLVTEMILKDSDTFVRKISDEEIDKFVKYGIKIVITGKVKE